MLYKPTPWGRRRPLNQRKMWGAPNAGWYVCLQRMAYLSHQALKDFERDPEAFKKREIEFVWI